VSEVRSVAAKNNIPFDELMAAARSLGVMTIKRGRERYWRLPDVVVPFTARETRSALRAALAGAGGNAA
jgi:hypothetical protein